MTIHDQVTDDTITAWANSARSLVQTARDRLTDVQLEALAEVASEVAVRVITPALAPVTNQEASRESLVRTIEDLHRVIRKRNDEISALRMECRDLTKEVDWLRNECKLQGAEIMHLQTEVDELRAAQAKPAPRPLAVGDRVRVVGMIGQLAEGDVGTIVVDGTGADGDKYGFQRDGTEPDAWVQVAAANVERIEDER